jgi:hypothetical protein
MAKSGRNLGKKHKLCPNCETHHCKRIAVNLLNDDSYGVKYKCTACLHEWDETCKLYNENTKGYMSIALPGLRSKSARLHRWVWEQYYKEKLEPGTEIHHKNWKKNDNRPQNLMKMNNHIEHLRLIPLVLEYEMKIKELEIEIERLKKTP